MGDTGNHQVWRVIVIGNTSALHWEQFPIICLSVSLMAMLTGLEKSTCLFIMSGSSSRTSKNFKFQNVLFCQQDEWILWHFFKPFFSLLACRIRGHVILRILLLMHYNASWYPWSACDSVGERDIIFTWLWSHSAGFHDLGCWHWRWYRDIGHIQW